MITVLVISVFLLDCVGFNPVELFNGGGGNTTAESTFSLGPGTGPPEPRGGADEHWCLPAQCI